MSYDRHSAVIIGNFGQLEIGRFRAKQSYRGALLANWEWPVKEISAFAGDRTGGYAYDELPNVSGKALTAGLLVPFIPGGSRLAAHEFHF